MGKKHILVAEDDKENLEILALILRSEHYMVSTAINGKEALQIIVDAKGSSCPVELLITDIQMPVLNGLELIGSLNKLNIGLPVIAITAYGNDKLYKELSSIGCEIYLDKPFSKTALLERVYMFFLNKIR